MMRPITNSRCWSCATPSMHRAELVDGERSTVAPRRRWRNSAGPGESSRIAIAIAASRGARTTSRTAEPTTSSARQLASTSRPPRSRRSDRAGCRRLRAAMLRAASIARDDITERTRRAQRQLASCSDNRCSRGAREDARREPLDHVVLLLLGEVGEQRQHQGLAGCRLGVPERRAVDLDGSA